MIQVEETDKYFILRFPYDPALIEAVKLIPGRLWHKDSKTWRVPLTERRSVQRLLGKGSTGTVLAQPRSIPESAVSITCTKSEPWTHQLAALKFAWNKDAVLFHLTMGSGKSKIIVDYVHNKAGIKKVLIACPLSVVNVWVRQFAVHGGRPVAIAALDESCTVVQKQVKAKYTLIDAKNRNIPAVIVVNYDSLWRQPFADWALDAGFDLVVADEIQRLKTPGSKVSRYAHRLSKVAPVRFGLSGTPFPHSPLDAYGVYRALDSTIFGTRYENFQRSFAIMGGFSNRQVLGFINQSEMREKIDTIRFHMEPEGYSLPEAVHSDILLTLPERTQKLYDKLRKELYAKLAEGSISVANAAVLLTRLQQLCCGYLPVEGEDGVKVVQELHSLKQTALEDLLDGLQPDEPVVVFCRFIHDLQAIHKAAEATGRKSSELSGRVKTLTEWQAGKSTVLATQLRAGSVGVDLTRAHRVVYWSYDFSLESYIQSLARVRRPGQAKTCYYHHLIVENSVDMRIRKALEDRKTVIDALLEDER
jgi:SNF2 family DNA or RNA helicase